jgi:hypothetical protein
MSFSKNIGITLIIAGIISGAGWLLLINNVPRTYIYIIEIVIGIVIYLIVRRWKLI